MAECIKCHGEIRRDRQIVQVLCYHPDQSTPEELAVFHGACWTQYSVSRNGMDDRFGQAEDIICELVRRELVGLKAAVDRGS